MLTENCFKPTGRPADRVETVLGSLSGALLGYCQPHEHIFVHPTPLSEKNPALAIDDFAASERELLQYHAAGGMAIVDAQPVGAGRDAAALRALSEASGVTIIASTGYHLSGFYSPDSPLHDFGELQLTTLFTSELVEGMLEYGGERSGVRTSIRAGIVKAAIPSEGAQDRYKTLLCAAARAAVDTARPLLLHTEAGMNAEAAIECCFACGLAPQDILVCHVDRRTDDYSRHEALAQLGVYLEYDTIGRFKYHSDQDEIALILHMLERGYAQRLLLSLDTTAARLGEYGGDITLRYLLRHFIPKLQCAGISGDVVRQLMVDNSRRALCRPDKKEQ